MCPECNGDKVLRGIACPGFKMIEIKCPLCKGIGELSAEQWDWHQQGKKLRDLRLSNDVSLREEAKRRGITASTLSDMEHGRLEPKFS